MTYDEQLSSIDLRWTQIIKMTKYILPFFFTYLFRMSRGVLLSQTFEFPSCQWDNIHFLPSIGKHMERMHFGTNTTSGLQSMQMTQGLRR